MTDVHPKRIMLLGAGELGREVAIAAQRLGQRVIAVDRYDGAPAMQVAHDCAVLSMLDADALRGAVLEFEPDLLVPEVEAIATDLLLELEARGTRVVPTARAAGLTMHREALRELAVRLGLPVAAWRAAGSPEELAAGAAEVGFPCVVKPVMSSSGKGQSVARAPEDVAGAWDHAMTAGRGRLTRVLVEAMVEIELEITLLVVRTRDGAVRFCPPIGHVQQHGDYRESWIPAHIPRDVLREAESMAEAITGELCRGDQGQGAGLFGVEFFLGSGGLLFSEVSPRPHDTGLVTLIGQTPDQFELHVRAMLDLPIPEIRSHGPAASAVILATSACAPVCYTGLAEALAQPGTDLRLFGKPDAHAGRRMGVALALGDSTDEARDKARRAASRISLVTGS